ncbi:MAG TPA: hypothetical protein VMU93_07225 [Caulobacteraceae bacterium]|nr:hypothetical protein [Caulobacteraceae bacterium]
MSESSPRDELEGWGVRWRIALWGVAGFFAFLFVSIGGMYLFYLRAGSPHVNTRPAMAFPGPGLNPRLDSAPGWSFAPPNPQESGPDPQVLRAMHDVAARGDAGYAPLAAPPPGLPPQTIGTPGAAPGGTATAGPQP